MTFSTTFGSFSMSLLLSRHISANPGTSPLMRHVLFGIDAVLPSCCGGRMDSGGGSNTDGMGIWDIPTLHVFVCTDSTSRACAAGVNTVPDSENSSEDFLRTVTHTSARTTNREKSMTASLYLRAFILSSHLLTC